jgi:phage integrase
LNSEKSAVSAACGAEPHFCFEESADALYPELSLTIGNDGHYGMPENERIFPIVQEAVQHKMKHQMEKAGVKKIRVHAFIVISCRGFLIIYGFYCEIRQNFLFIFHIFCNIFKPAIRILHNWFSV